MPDTPIKPPNKRVEELTTKITFDTFDKFKHITNRQERQQWMIDYLGKELALAWAKIEIYENQKE